MKLQFLIENYNFLFIQQIQSVFLLLYLENKSTDFRVKIEKNTHVSIFFDFLKIFCIYSCEYHSMSNRFILLFSFHLWFFEVFLIFFFFPSSFYVSTFFPFYFYYFFSFSFPSIKEIKLLDFNFSLLLNVITSGYWCKVYYMMYSIRMKWGIVIFLQDPFLQVTQRSKCLISICNRLKQNRTQALNLINRVNILNLS